MKHGFERISTGEFVGLCAYDSGGYYWPTTPTAHKPEWPPTVGSEYGGYRIVAVLDQTEDYNRATKVRTGTEVLKIGDDWCERPITREKTAEELAAWREALTTALTVAIKTEANRRILAVAKEHEQRNLLARAVLLADKGRANWTPEEAAEWAAGEAIWGRIVLIRAESDVIEARLEHMSDDVLAAFNPRDDDVWL